MSEDKDRNVEEAEQAPMLNAWYMTQADVDAIIGQVADTVANVTKLLPAFMEGLKLDEVRDALNQAVNALKSGPIKDFVRKNGALLKNHEAEFMNTNGNDGKPEDRQAVVNLYKFATKTSELTDAVCNYFDYFTRVYAGKANGFFCFHRDMQAVFSGDYIAHLGKVFHEYCYFIEKFNHASIYSSMEVSKNLAFEDNLKLVQEQMDYEISNLNNLSTVLADSTRISASESNMFYILDRLTREFADFDNELKNGGDTMIDSGEKLKAQIGTFRGLPGFLIAVGYFKALEELITKLGFVFLEAQNILQKFKSSSDAPYAIMHYDANVQKAANTYLYVSLDDPLKSGTNYRELAKQMVIKNREMAKVVAKNAP